MQDLFSTDIQARKHVLDHTGHTVPIRQHELDHTDQEPAAVSALPGRCRSGSENRGSVRGCKHSTDYMLLPFVSSMGPANKKHPT